MTKPSKNAKKQPYPVTVTDKDGNSVEPGTPVVIDQDSADSILKTFGTYQGAPNPSPADEKTVEVPVADLEHKAVKTAISDAVEAEKAKLEKAKEAWEAFQTVPDGASDTDYEAAAAAVTEAVSA